MTKHQMTEHIVSKSFWDLMDDLGGRVPPSLWRGDLDRLLCAFVDGFSDTDMLLQTLHEAQRLRMIYAARLENSEALKEALSRDPVPLWNEYTTPPVADDLQVNLGRNMYNMKSGDIGIVELYNGAKAVGRATVERCLENGDDFQVFFAEPEFVARVLIHADLQNVPAIAQVKMQGFDRATSDMYAVSLPSAPSTAMVSPEKSEVYARETASIKERKVSGDLYYTVTMIPSLQDAELDQVSYDDYIRLFFEACDQPWDGIKAAQEPLIERLNAGKLLHITNSDGTDLKVGIDGFTFCNSVTAKNIPGSEIFSGPERESVNGIIVSKGIFRPSGSKGIVRDMTLPFVNGRLTDRFNAGAGRDVLAEFLNRAEGNRYCGEIGLGTNAHIPHFLKNIGQLKVISNPLMVEKIGGSFHVAVGSAYTYTSYEGIPVKVDNGNRGHQGDHWDITTLLAGKNGTIDLDGKPLMRDGRWLGKEFAVLNDGWQAVPRNERPAFWQTYYDAPKV